MSVILSNICADRTYPKLIARACAALTLLFLAAPAVSAQNLTSVTPTGPYFLPFWNGGSGGNWNDPNNWSESVQFNYDDGSSLTQNLSNFVPAATFDYTTTSFNTGNTVVIDSGQPVIANDSASADLVFIGYNAGGVSSTGLTIQAAGALSDNNGYIGYNTGSTGVVLVTGANAGWTNTNFLLVGTFGNGSLTITNGATVSDFSGPATNAEAGAIGLQPGSNGIATVDGPLSTWTNTGILAIAHLGNGTLTISGGATITDIGTTIGNIVYYAADIGTQAGSLGTVTVTGAGTTWTNNSGGLTVGYEGTGSLIISNGGIVTDATTPGYFSANIGGAAGSNGSVTVTGSGSEFINNTSIVLGDSGNGSLTISDSGAVTSNGGSIGNNAGSNGTVTVTGNGSMWTNTDFLTVGNLGTGNFMIANSGTVTSNSGLIAFGAGSIGTVAVTDVGSTWTIAGNLIVGDSGTGNLTISNGGAVISNSGFIGNFSGSTGTVTVTGNGSTWSDTGILTVGNAGAGSMTIDNGGQVVVTNGLRVLANGTVNVNVGGNLSIGTGGIGAITLNGGVLDLPTNATAYANTLSITDNSTVNLSAASVTLSGVISGNRTLLVTGLSAGRTLSLGASMSQFNGTLSVDDSSQGFVRFNFSGTNSNRGSTTTIFDLGNSQATLTNRNGGGQTYNLGALSGGANTILTGASATGATSSIYSIGALGLDTTFAGSITDNTAGRTVAVTKVGTGTLTLSGANSYSGLTRVNAGTLNILGSMDGTSYSALGGTLAIGASNLLPSTATVSVTNATFSAGSYNQTLSNLNVTNGTVSGNGLLTITSGLNGTGNITPDLLLNPGAVLTPGNGIATLNVGNLTWGGSNDGSATMKYTLSTINNSSSLLNATGAFIKGAGSNFIFDFQDTGFFDGLGDESSTYTLITSSSILANTGFTLAQFSAINVGANGADTASGYFIFGNGGTSLEFIALPEPATSGLWFGLALMGIGLLRFKGKTIARSSSRCCRSSPQS